MKIILAKEAGFCFGVKRASDLALSNGNYINTLGPLIHNPTFVEFLEEKGIFAVNKVDDINAKKVIIRSHGISKELEGKIMNKNIEVVDATCPFVKKVHKLAEQFESKGYKVLLLGEIDHPEVVGIKSYSPSSIIIKSIKDIPNFKKDEEIALISQTTQNTKSFDKIANYLRENFNNIEIINTICDATDKRQKAAGQLAGKVDIMIVIGGKNSSNTTRLKEVCEKFTKTYHIETGKELKTNWFNLAEKVGVTAGASTPDFLISTVLNKLKSYA